LVNSLSAGLSRDIRQAQRDQAAGRRLHRYHRVGERQQGRLTFAEYDVFPPLREVKRASRVQHQADVVRAVIALPHPPVARAEQPGRQQIQTRERMYRQVDLDRGAAQGLDLVPGAPAFEELAEQTRPLVLRGVFPRETEHPCGRGAGAEHDLRRGR
jgi:hypothetical protein